MATVLTQTGPPFVIRKPRVGLTPTVDGLTTGLADGHHLKADARRILQHLCFNYSLPNGLLGAGINGRTTSLADGHHLKADARRILKHLCFNYSLPNGLRGAGLNGLTTGLADGHHLKADARRILQHFSFNYSLPNGLLRVVRQNQARLPHSSTHSSRPPVAQSVGVLLYWGMESSGLESQARHGRHAVRWAPAVMPSGNTDTRRPDQLCLAIGNPPHSRAEKRGNDKDGIATHIKCAIAAKLKALNWRAVFSSHCIPMALTTTSVTQQSSLEACVLIVDRRNGLAFNSFAEKKRISNTLQHSSWARKEIASEVSMEQRRNGKMGGGGDPRENPLTSSIAQLDSHLQKSRNDPADNRTLPAPPSPASLLAHPGGHSSSCPEDTRQASARSQPDRRTLLTSVILSHFPNLSCTPITRRAQLKYQCTKATEGRNVAHTCKGRSNLTCCPTFSRYIRSISRSYRVLLLRAQLKYQCTKATEGRNVAHTCKGRSNLTCCPTFSRYIRSISRSYRVLLLRAQLKYQCTKATEGRNVAHTCKGRSNLTCCPTFSRYIRSISRSYRVLLLRAQLKYQCTKATEGRNVAHTCKGRSNLTCCPTFSRYIRSISRSYRVLLLRAQLKYQCTTATEGRNVAHTRAQLKYQCTTATEGRNVAHTCKGRSNLTCCPTFSRYIRSISRSYRVLLLRAQLKYQCTTATEGRNVAHTCKGRSNLTCCPTFSRYIRSISRSYRVLLLRAQLKYQCTKATEGRKVLHTCKGRSNLTCCPTFSRYIRSISRSYRVLLLRAQLKYQCTKATEGRNVAHTLRRVHLFSIVSIANWMDERKKQYINTLVFSDAVTLSSWSNA
ncbi:hypothetical protein PR048_033051 [Dryococelus australis]|uniref:Uncharacterized protein n=1 Tax=Dryococelus australis TaxID=614101 RepID=A0ABQ9G3D1_9NEOP|nr:hypothetical protein PR048_033051 [Dryococelus australis]